MNKLSFAQSATSNNFFEFLTNGMVPLKSESLPKGLFIPSWRNLKERRL